MSLWESYRTSIFLCHQQLGNHINFAIISAQNPAGTVKNPYLNLRLNKEFEAFLHQQRLPYRSVIGSSPDLSFQEKSWIVMCDKPHAVSLARHFHQNAIYWIEQGNLYLVPVLLDHQEECLGAFQSRLVILPD